MKRYIVELGSTPEEELYEWMYDNVGNLRHWMIYTDIRLGQEFCRVTIQFEPEVEDKIITLFLLRWMTV